jgi:putative ABC transport system substrate-binding protein
MRRRDFITNISATLVLPNLLSAQPNRIRSIGVLSGFSENDPHGSSEIQALNTRLTELGWINGQNIQIHYRWANGNVSKIKSYAKELVALQPDVIIGRATPVVTALVCTENLVPLRRRANRVS